MTDTEFASAPYVLHQHQIALISAAETIGALENNIKVLEKRVAKLEAQLIGIGEAFSRANARNKAMWEAPMTLPSERATDADSSA